ncbi:hypothetical protein F4778DRAFT_373374 [Xylariomycetidae sp. FL2044]|nr:hypothetical protein F4778DRAFT_373374 [Xylariomycetidae sp. FL2044]
MSVVDGDWDELKRYNIHELYVASSKVKKQQKEKEKVDNDERDKAEGRDGGAEDLKADIKDESPTKSDVKVEDEAAKVSKKNIEDTDVEMS